MAHGILERDFVKANSLETDWHKKTLALNRVLTREDFPDVVLRDLQFDNGSEFKPLVTGGNVWRIPVSDDDGLPCGEPIGESFSLFTPRQGFDWIHEMLSGTGFSVERVGMLWNRSRWFISIHLDEIATLARPGEKFQLNVSTGLDGSLARQAELSNIRVVCHNTNSLSRVMGQVLFRAKNTKNANSRMNSDEIRKEFDKAAGMARVWNEAMAGLENTACHEQTAREIYAGAVIPKDAEKVSTAARNTVDGLTGLFRSGLGNNGRTMADVLHGFTQFGTRGFETSKKDTWTRIESSEFGGMADKKADFTRAMFSENAREGMRENGAKLLSLPVN